MKSRPSERKLNTGGPPGRCGLDARVAWEAPGDRSEIAAYLRNLTDKDYIKAVLQKSTCFGAVWRTADRGSGTQGTSRQERVAVL